MAGEAVRLGVRERREDWRDRSKELRCWLGTTGERGCGCVTGAGAGLRAGNDNDRSDVGVESSIVATAESDGIWPVASCSWRS